MPSPVSQETAARADHRINEPIIDPATTRRDQSNIPLPSSFAPPTVVDDAPQQASTQPGDGGVVQTGVDTYQQYDSSSSGEGAFPRDSGEKKVPFKEQVIGVAQKTRGAILRKPSLKEHGEKILDGQTTHAQDKAQ